MSRPPIKCLVLDLDGTLWAGVLAEGGREALALGPDGAGAPHYAFRQYLAELGKGGMLLAIASKNDYAEATAVIDEAEDFLIDEYVVSMKISWEPKSRGIEEMSAELGLGIDSFLFLDDSPFEREEVRSALPSVLVPDLPSDPAEYVPFLQAMPELSSGETTEEAAGRARSYRLRSDRSKMRSESSAAEVNEKLNTIVGVVEATADDAARISELSLRTNQFNMVGSRYSVEAVYALLASREHEVYRIVVRDDLEHLGTVGVVVLRRDEKRLWIEEFLLSCRVLSREVEQAVLWRLATRGLGDGARYLVGRYVPAERNQAVAGQTYRVNGFVEDESGEWVLDLRGVLPAKPQGISVVSEAAAVSA